MSTVSQRQQVTVHRHQAVNINKYPCACKRSWRSGCAPSWRLHVVPVYKPSSTLTATNHCLAHGHLSIQKEGAWKAKSPSCLLLLTFLLAPKGLQLGIAPCALRVLCVQSQSKGSKGDLEKTWRRALWGHSKQHPSSPFPVYYPAQWLPLHFQEYWPKYINESKHVLFISKYEWHAFPWAPCFLELFELETNQPVSTIDLFSKTLSSLKNCASPCLSLLFSDTVI